MNKRTLFLSFFIFSIVISLSACSKNPYLPNYSLAPAPFDTTGAPKTVLSDGLVYYQIQKGYGPFKVVQSDQVQVEYTGRKTNGKIFDSTFEKRKIGTPFYVTLAASGSYNGFAYIRGFREGLLGMRVGEERTIVIPPDLGYAGTTSALASDTLIFDVKLVQIL